MAGAAGGDDEAAPGRVVVWDRARDGGFPDVVELKRRIRDVVAPDKPLGHADRLAETDGTGD
ncbi:Rdx family protein [Cellulomonas fulva]|uniref:Rdx family protein n=1 Tax=Cellulomonas fulva TaxID=2835530 RepID=UPI0027DE3216|nr:Rdx family protein [Cellulomonas fulva]